ncbi:MAG TPA: flagellar hook-basal body complex protein FliE [Stellaceae bacterium]|nr:flagellar hook-basal body complex protein FliE [Stellaceae bacterium]
MSDPAAVMAAMLSDLQGLAGLAGAVPTPAAGIAAPAASSFLDTLKDAVGRIDGAVASSESKTNQFAAGDKNVSLSDVMISVEQANLAFQTATTVRDRVVEAYQTIMNMQL